jgi:hypothetical protein
VGVSVVPIVPVRKTGQKNTAVPVREVLPVAKSFLDGWVLSPCGGRLKKVGDGPIATSGKLCPVELSFLNAAR